MADVQLENGFLRIANTIFDNIVKMPLNGTQFRIVLLLWRETYGFNRKECPLSLSYISKATGASKRFISSELKKLVDANIILIFKAATFTDPQILVFNKDFETWDCSTLQQVNDSSTGDEQLTSTGEQQFHSTGERSFYQVKTPLKTPLKTPILREANEIDSRISEIWELYPRKQGKATAVKKIPKLIKQYGYEQIKRTVERYSAEVKGQEPQFIKHGSTFFNNGYVDYLDVNYKPQEQEQNRFSNYVT
jgi:phage replication O-like protein O